MPRLHPVFLSCLLTLSWAQVAHAQAPGPAPNKPTGPRRKLRQSTPPGERASKKKPPIAGTPDDWVEALGAEDAAAATKASEALKSQKDAGVAALLRRLEGSLSPLHELRIRRLLAALGKLPPLTPARLEALYRDLTNPDWAQRERATELLTEYRRQAFGLLSQGLRSSDPERRLRCSFILRRAELDSERLLEVMASAGHTGAGTAAYAEFRAAGGLYLRPLLDQIHGASSRSPTPRAQKRLALCLDLLQDLASPEHSRVISALISTDLQGDFGKDSPFPLLIAALAKLPSAPVIRAAFAALEASTEASNAYLGQQACQVLAEIGTSEDIPRLLRALDHPTSLTRLAVARAVRALARRPEDVEGLAPLLTDEDEDAALLALEILGELEVKELSPEVTKLLGSDSDSIRASCVITLGMIGDPNAATTLRGLWAPPLDGTDGENKELLEGLEPLRGKLAWALAKLGAITSNELIAFVSSEPAHRRLGYLALAAEGSAASLRHLALRAQMPARNSTKDNKRNQTNRDSRLLAAEALGTSQESDALEHLLMLAKVDNGALQQACLRALRDQQTAASRLKLLELTIEAAGESFDRGCEYLGKLNVRAAAPALIAALSKSQSEELLEALGHLGGADARRALRVISNKVPPAMKRKAAQALARAGDTSLMPRLIKETLRSVQSNNSTGNVTRYLNRLGIDYLYAAEWPDAILAFRRMTWVDPTTINAAYNRACIAAMRGRKERALSFLRRSLDYNIASWSTASQWRHFETDPDLHSLHDDPRFKRLMARLKRRYYLERR